MSADFTAEDIEKACAAGYENIRSWLYDDIELVVRNNGRELLHNLADIEMHFRDIKDDIIDGQLFSRGQVIDYLLQQNARLDEVGTMKELREAPMIFTQLAKGLGVYQEMLATQKQRNSSKLDRS